MGCTSLTNLTIGGSVSVIDDDAFRDCTSLTSVTIGSSVTSIGDKAFSGCDSLNTVYSNASALALNPVDGCWPSSGDILFMDADGDTLPAVR